MTGWGNDPNAGSGEPEQPPQQPDPWGPQPPQPRAPDYGQPQPPSQPDPWGQQPQPPQQPDPYAQPPQQPPAPPYGQPPQPAAPQYGQPPQQQPYGQPAYGQPPQYGQPGAYPAAPGYSAYGQQPGISGAGVPANMGARLGARIIDGLLIGIPLGIIGAILGSPTSWSLVEIVVLWGYVAYFNGTQQQTIGKKVLGIKVVDAATGGAIGIGRALLRDVVLFVTGLLCFVGYFSPFFDGTKRYQGWHDKAASDFVISSK